MSEKDKSSYVIQTIANALGVLGAISEESGDFGLSSLSAKLGLERNYVFRVLATFEQCGYVRQVGSSGRYQAGPAAYETGGRFLHQFKLLQKARPIMETLAKDCGEAIYLAIASERDFLLLDMVDSPQQVRVIPLVGRRFARSQFSAGKVIQACSGGTDKPNGGQQVAVDHGQLDEEIGSLSVPILNAQGLACASLCLVAPEFRLSQEQIDKTLLPLLKTAGHELSASLGYIGNELLKKCG